MTAASRSVAIVICAYTEERWDQLLAAYGSLLGQAGEPPEIVVVIDHNPALLQRLSSELPHARILSNTGSAGLSGARNTGVAATTAEIVLFLDDDAIAGPDWLRHITSPFADPAVQGVAGWATPQWGPSGRPRWFPESFLWVVGCSYEGLPDEQSDVRNPLGCAMGFRRSAWALVGGFSDTLGRVGTHPIGCEETEFSIRLRRATPSARIVMVPNAIVEHRVAESRLSVKYFLARCYWEGVSKSVVSASAGSRDALESERPYISRVLPRAFGRGILESVRGDLSGCARSMALAAGLVATTAGFLRGRVEGSRDAPPIGWSQPLGKELSMADRTGGPDPGRRSADS